MRPDTSGKLAYAIAELPELVSLGRSHIYEEIRAGKLRTVKVGRRTLVLAEDLRAWLLSLDRAADSATRLRGLPRDHG
jgi:excisionase family DNA binding protein